MGKNNKTQKNKHKIKIHKNSKNKMSYKRNNKTNNKKGGTAQAPTDSTQQTSFFNTIAENAKKILEKTVGFMTEKGARVFGFQKIDEDGQQGQQGQDQKQDSNEFMSTAKNKAEQVGTILTNTINKNTFGNEQLQEQFQKSVELFKTNAQLFLEKINKIVNDKKFVALVQTSIANFSRIVDVMMTAANPAINKTIDMLSKILQESIDKIGTASVKAGLDVAGTVPGVGEVIEGVRVMDDVVKAVLASTDAIVKSMSTVSIGITDTISSFKQKMAESGNIMNRAQSNITQFTNTDVPTIPIPTPTPVQKIGGTRSKIKNKKYNKKIYKIY